MVIMGYGEMVLKKYIVWAGRSMAHSTMVLLIVRHHDDPHC